MSFLDNSGQKVGDNSNAIQVTGNLNVGNTTTEVMTICNLVISTQMAALRQEAQEEARLRALEFGNQIIKKLSSEVEDIVIEKLKDPDIQFAMNQSIVQVARKGIGAKSDLLKELIVSKIKNNEEEIDLLIDHALDITQRLTTSELKFLSIVFYFRFCIKTQNGVILNHVVEQSDESYNENGINKIFCRAVFNEIYKNSSIDFDKITDGIEKIKPINLTMLDVKGCTTSEKHYTKNYFALIKERSGVELIDNDYADFRKKFNTIATLLDKFGIKNLEEFNSAVLSPLGMIISENYLCARGFFTAHP